MDNGTLQSKTAWTPMGSAKPELSIGTIPSGRNDNNRTTQIDVRGGHGLPVWGHNGSVRLDMKLTKKQLSASYVMQATASKSLKEQASPGGFTKGDVANHGNSRFGSCPMASPPRQGRVHPTSQLRKTSGDKAMESIAGLENQPGVEITPLQLYVEEGPQSVKSGIPATRMARRDGNGGDGAQRIPQRTAPVVECE